MIPIPESRVAERAGPKASPFRSRRRGSVRCKGALAAVALVDYAGVAVAGAVPQTHPDRRDVPSARALATHEQAKQFSELLDRPFSHGWREDSVGWTDLHYAALLDLPGVVVALCDRGWLRLPA